MIATKTDFKVLVRLPKKVLRNLNAQAKKSSRSRNSEIVHRLEQSLGLTKKASTQPPAIDQSPAPDSKPEPALATTA